MDISMASILLDRSTNEAWRDLKSSSIFDCSMMIIMDASNPKIREF
jgi:hypothetical protein